MATTSPPTLCDIVDDVDFDEDFDTDYDAADMGTAFGMECSLEAQDRDLLGDDSASR